MATRKSSREVKKPEILSYEKNLKQSNRTSELSFEVGANHSNTSSKQLQQIEEEDDDDYDDENNLDNFDDFFGSKPKKRRGRKSSSNINETTKNKSKQQSNGSNLSLFEVIQNEKDFDESIEDWIALFKTNHVAAMVELINTMLLSGGSGKKWIKRDVDLEALDTEEIKELLSDHLQELTDTAEDKIYPLIDKKSTKGKNYRKRFQSFWERFAILLIEWGNEDKTKKTKVFDPIRRVINLMKAFSSISLAGIRDSVTEAMLSFAKGMIDLLLQGKHQRNNIERQLNSEEKKKTSKQELLKNPKYKAFEEQRLEITKLLEAINVFIKDIFNSIFIHRSKDFHENIRLICIKHLFSFVSFDINTTIKTEYLKYYGWALYDRNDLVRLEAVQAIKRLIENVEYLAHLQNFIDHFMDRFVEIACQDINSHVSVMMIESFRIMQRQGFLDNLAEEKLAEIDILVLDPGASLAMRKEALLFFMDHTEGFEENESDLIATTTNKTAKLSKAHQQKLKEQQLSHAIQLETITEFAEHYTKNNLESSKLLAEAILITSKARILYDWSTCFSLIMKETKDFTTTIDLQSSQIEILLSMLLYAIQDLSKQMNQSLPQSIQHDHWNSFHTEAMLKLPLLLKRYQTSELFLLPLLNLCQCLDITFILSKQQQELFVTQLLPILTTIFHQNHTENILKTIVSILKSWSNQVQWERYQSLDDILLNEGYKFVSKDNSAMSMLRDLIQTTWDDYQNITKNWQHIIQNPTSQTQTTKRGNKRRASSSSSSSASSAITKDNSLSELETCLMNLHILFMKLKVFWQVLDPRAFDILPLDDMIASLIESVELLFQTHEALVNPTKLSQQQIAQSTDSICQILTHILLWAYKDIILIGNIFNSSKNTLSNKDSNTLVDILDEKCNELLSNREKLVDTTVLLMDLPVIDSESKAISLHRDLRLIGFQTISKLRSFFPQRATDYQYIDKLAYQPSTDVIDFLRKIFDEEGKLLLKELNESSSHSIDSSKGTTTIVSPPSSDQSKQTNELSQRLVNQLFYPLTKSLVYDISNVNRRQAGAILMYFTHPNEAIQESIKIIAKKFKDTDLNKYIEIQLVTLRDYFSSNLLPILERLQILRESEDELQESEAEEYRTLEANLELYSNDFLSLSRKLSQIMGVGKLKDQALEKLLSILQGGVNFAFESPTHLGFLECLEYYLRYVTPNVIYEIQSYTENKLQDNVDLYQEYENHRENPTGPLLSLSRWLQAISPNGVRRTSLSSKRSKSLSTSVTFLEPNNKKRGRPTKKDQQTTKTTSVPKGPRGRKPKALTLETKSKTTKKNIEDSLNVSGSVRRSSRSVAQKRINYNEDKDFLAQEDSEDEVDEEEVSGDEEEDEERDEFIEVEPLKINKQQQQRLSNTSRRSRPSFGLILEDIDEVPEGDDEEEENVKPAPKRHSNMSRFSDFSARDSLGISSSSYKRSREESPFEIKPFDIDSSPIIKSTWEELDSIPSKRRHLNH